MIQAAGVYPAMKRAAYPTDLTDREWQMLEPLVPPVKPGGRPAKDPRRAIVNGLRYVLRTGCSWRLRPQARQALSRRSSPRAAILDSPSVKTTDKGGSEATTRASR